VVRESFSEYKKTLDQNILSIDYLYAGDINSSIYPIFTYSEVRNLPLTSPSFIISCIKQIYKNSFDLLKEKAVEVIIPESRSVDISQLLSKMDSILSHQCKYVFTSKSSYKYIGFDNISTNSNRGLPSYFYEMTRIVGAQSRIYISPEVEELEDIFTLYATDHPFQSMVYVIQNMEYEIIPESTDLVNNKNWIHKISYTLYDCKFSAIKIIIKNISKIREEKINEILS
jgi:hypothetical protein